MSPTFTGFPPEAFEFFRQLARHNNRDWFQAHKGTYERACRAPMNELVAEVGADSERSWTSRINRDVRFSRDKSPYRTHIAAAFDRNYIALSAEGLYVGGGIYMPEPGVLERFRRAIADEASGRQLQKIIASLRRKGYEVDTHERLTGAPRGYPADHPRIELLRMKDIFAGKTFPPEKWLSTPNALTGIRQVIKDVKPLTEWIRTHVSSRAA